MLDEALPHLRRAIELHPTYYDAMLAFGACAYYVQEYQTSVNAYRSALQLYPADAKSGTGLAYALQALGGAQWDQQDTARAVETLKEAYQLRPDTATARQLSGYYRTMGQSEKSMEWLNKAHGVVR
jgi:tetratricopeptide (TPR) repeat protein